MRSRILFICGSINQTSQMHRIASYLNEYDCRFSPYYSLGFIGWLKNRGLTEFSILGDKLGQRCLDYLHTHDLPVDYRGMHGEYDLVLTCSDLVVPANIRGTKTILVQEGMTDPENLLYRIVRALRLPRWIASTSTTGLSHRYDYFCVASEGYRDLFISKGVHPDRLRVTGIPNFDNCARFLDNDFPHRGYLLAATSDARETFKYENRRRFIEQCLRLAGGRKVIFKLHPNENRVRATAEIERWAPDALIFRTGNTDQMIANCDILVTSYSSVVYVGLALGKEVHSMFDRDDLLRMMPIQNNGRSGQLIAEICRRHLEGLRVPEDLHWEIDPYEIDGGRVVISDRDGVPVLKQGDLS